MSEEGGEVKQELSTIKASARILPTTTEPTTPQIAMSVQNEEKKAGHGIVFSAYSSDNSTLAHLMLEIGISAEKLKNTNPTVQVALITNAPKAMVPNVIDHIIEVEEKLLLAGDFSRGDQKSRQWFTRLYYLARSPFKVTCYFDSHAVFATDKVNQLLQQFDDLDIDVATANSSPHSFSCHNFSILFKWNDRVKLMFQDWILAQLRAGINV